MKVLIVGQDIPGLAEAYPEDEFKHVEDLESVEWCNFLISYNYNKIIKTIKPNIINIHISYLPFNRGADPNFWSWINETPSGVSIHYITKKVDEGPILVQEILEMDEKDTLKTSYNKLQELAKKLIIENWGKIKRG